MAYGEYAKAQPLAEQALTLARKGGSRDSELSLCLIDLAYVYTNQGRYANAEEMCKLGLGLQEEVYYKEHPYVAYTLRILSNIYQGQGRYRAAGQVLDRAMAIMEKCHPPGDPIMAPFQVAVAKLLVAQGNFAEAETYYLQALA